MILSRAIVSVVPGFIILAGVVLLLTSVFHALLLWIAFACLGLGLILMAAACVESLVFEKSPANFGVPSTPEPHKES